MTHGLERGLSCAIAAAVLVLACSADDAPPPGGTDTEAPASATAGEPEKADTPEPTPSESPHAAEEPAPPSRPAPSRPEGPAAEPSTSTEARPPAPEPPGLDLAELEQRLEKTRAIGLFTKLALRGDIEDLLGAIEAYHDRGRGRLDALRERFDLLVMKVISLLQDDDPDLAQDLARSRENLWGLLADPERFAALST